MTRLFIALLMLQINPGPTGTATGIVLSANGIPVSGVRVFAIPAGAPDSIPMDSTVYESLTQTGVTGRYRLVIPPGRYYIGAGAVNLPTFYPDSTSVASAKAIVISADTTVDDINFSKFNPPPPSANGFASAPIPTVVFSGVILLPDGNPASGVPVVSVPTPLLNATGSIFTPDFTAIFNSVFASLATTPPSLRIDRIGSLTVTDSTGHYRIDNVSPGSYNILAGFADSPSFFPDAADVRIPGTIASTSAALDKLNFSLSRPLTVQSSIRGKVLGVEGKPTEGAEITIADSGGSRTGIGMFLPRRSEKTTRTGADGTYLFSGLPPGSYTVQAELNGSFRRSQKIVVLDRPADADFTFPISIVAGKIVWEDGSIFSETLPSQVALRTSGNPDLIETSLIDISNSGIFTRIMESGAYRFFVPDLPNGYEIRSITSATTDLTRRPLQFKDNVSVDVELRLAKVARNGAMVRGRIVDAVAAKPPPAGRVRLCCLETGPFERLSAAIQLDGSFEFSGVPPGQYSLELQSDSTAQVINPLVEVGNEKLSGLNIVTATQFVVFQIIVNVDGAGGIPDELRIPVNWTAPNDAFQVLTSGGPGNLYWTLPAGVEYSITISGMPAGFGLKSVQSGGTDLQPDPQTRSTTFRMVPADSNPLVITLIPIFPQDK